MVRPFNAEAGSDGGLGASVGNGDLGAVRLTVDRQPCASEVRQRDGVGHIGEREGQGKVVGVVVIVIGVVVIGALHAFDFSPGRCEWP
jgi:hypothetical protein